MNADNADPDGDEEESLAAILDAHHDRLQHSIARRVRGDAGAVKDILQETLTQLVAYYDQRGDLSPADVVRLLFTIARRRIGDWYRRSGRADRYPSDAELLAEAVARVDPEETVAKRLDVQRAMARLTPPQQQALVLVYVDGWDYQTAAELMGISNNGLKQHLRRAKTRARQLDELTGYGKTPASAEGGAQQ